MGKSKMISLKITGVEQLQKELDDAAKALQALDGEIAIVKYNSNDPSSVEAAVIQIEQTINAKIAPYRGNKIVESLATQLKERYRQEIYDRAAEARAQGETL
jgi:ferredoxin-fold anticodon binding domain-containing protein